MGLTVTFVSGPRQSGKSAVIRLMIDRLWKTEPHYIRLIDSESGRTVPPAQHQPSPGSGVASARWLKYDPEQIFEILPEALTAIHRRDRYGAVVIEADADPALRCAYPYDYRVFVMPVPKHVNEGFRTPEEAAAELKRVLDDTAAFASEIFGLFEDNGSVDTDPSEERADLTATQMRGFLYSPLGDELATRIQLQAPYHGLVESDVILMNTDLGSQGPEADECVRRVERLMQRLRGGVDRRSAVFACDPRDVTGAQGKKLLKALKAVCVSGK